MASQEYDVDTINKLYADKAALVEAVVALVRDIDAYYDEHYLQKCKWVSLSMGRAALNKARKP